MSFQHRIGVRHKLQLESTTFGERIPINREIEFGMTKIERLRFLAALRMTSIRFSTEQEIMIVEAYETPKDVLV